VERSEKFWHCQRGVWEVQEVSGDTGRGRGEFYEMFLEIFGKISSKSKMDLKTRGKRGKEVSGFISKSLPL
jgi:hypothetical protein